MLIWGSGGSLAGLRIGLPINRLQRGTRSHQCLGNRRSRRKQTHSPTGKVVGQVGQILLPMIAGIAATKVDLTEWVYEQGLTALHLLLREDAEEIAGLKGKHEKERTHNHWGSTTES